jgi:hypothetical protein
MLLRRVNKLNTNFDEAIEICGELVYALKNNTITPASVKACPSHPVS